MIALTSRERRNLRARGHHLEPVVRIGQSGLHPAVLSKVEVELHNHELIKVKVVQGSPVGAREVGPLLAEQVDAALVQVIGGVILLYKERPPEEDDE